MTHLVDHAIVQASGRALPGSPRGALYNYYWCGNGIFVTSAREHLKIAFRISHEQTRGLGVMDEMFQFALPKAPVALVEQLWTISRAAAIGNLEKLFHLVWADDWQLIVPEQEQSEASCRPLADGPGSSHDRAVIEIHSHHEMPARFSAQDNREETGFRLYGVIGKVLTRPEIRMRVGLYGHFYEIPAARVLELPDGIRDCVYEAGN
jgi:PRTRC genetic system protein A